MPKKLFFNNNGSTYYILFGGKGKKSFLCNIERQQFVICAILEENSWCKEVTLKILKRLIKSGKNLKKIKKRGVMNVIANGYYNKRKKYI